MKRLTLLVAALTLLVLASACGQSGPLYIPGNPSQMAVPPSQDSADKEQQQEDKDNGEPSESD